MVYILQSRCQELAFYINDLYSVTNILGLFSDLFLKILGGLILNLSLKEFCHLISHLATFKTLFPEFCTEKLWLVVLFLFLSPI